MGEDETQRVGEVLEAVASASPGISLTSRATVNSDPHLKDIPVRYRHWRLADFPDSAQAKAREWLEDPGSWSLYLQGAVGTRKTSLAAAIVHECRIAGIRAMCCTLPRAVHHIRHCTDWWQGEIETAEE